MSLAGVKLSFFLPFQKSEKKPKKYHEGGWQSIVAYLEVGAKFREVCRYWHVLIDVFYISVCVNRGIFYSHFDNGLFPFWNLKRGKILAIVMGFINAFWKHLTAVADRLNPWVLFLSVIHFVGFCSRKNWIINSFSAMWKEATLMGRTRHKLKSKCSALKVYLS